MMTLSFIHPDDLFIPVSPADTVRLSELEFESGGSKLAAYHAYYQENGLSKVSLFLESLKHYRIMVSSGISNPAENTAAHLISHVGRLKSSAQVTDVWSNRTPNKIFHLLRLTRMEKPTKDFITILESGVYEVLEYERLECLKQIDNQLLRLRAFHASKNQEKIRMLLALKKALQELEKNLLKEKKRTLEDLLHRVEIASSFPLPTCDDVLFSQTLTNLTEDRILRFRHIGLSTESLEDAQDILKSEFLKLPSQFSRQMTPKLYAHLLKVLHALSGKKSLTLRLPLYEENSGALKTHNIVRKNAVLAIPSQLIAFIPKRFYLPTFIIKIFFKETYDRYQLFKNKQWLVLVLKTYPKTLDFLKGYPNRSLYVKEVLQYIDAEMKEISDRIARIKKSKGNTMFECLKTWEGLLLNLKERFQSESDSEDEADSSDSIESIECSTFSNDCSENSETSKNNENENKILEDFNAMEQLGQACPLPFARLRELMSIFHGCLSKAENPEFHTYFLEHAERIVTGMGDLIAMVATHRWAAHRDGNEFAFRDFIHWQREYYQVMNLIDHPTVKANAELIREKIHATFKKVILIMLEQILESLLNIVINTDKNGESENAQKTLAIQKEKLGVCIDLLKEFPWHDFKIIAPGVLYQRLNRIPLVGPVIKAYALSLKEGLDQEKMLLEGLGENGYRKVNASDTRVRFFPDKKTIRSTPDIHLIHSINQKG